MAVPYETISRGASIKCETCGVVVKLRVCSSGAGYYIGTMCDCGPYSRETGYFKNYKEAKKALDSDEYTLR